MKAVLDTILSCLTVGGIVVALFSFGFAVGSGNRYSEEFFCGVMVAGIILAGLCGCALAVVRLA